MDRKTLERVIEDLSRLRDQLAPDIATEVALSAPGVDVDQAQWLAGILAHSPDVISVLDLDGKLLYVSRTPTDRDPNWYAGHHSADFIPEPFREAWHRALERAKERGEPEHVEVFSSGDYFWATRIVPIKRSGVVTWLLTIGTNITAQRGAEAALALKQQQLTLALEASGMGQWSWDIACDEVTWDTATKRIFDWPEDRDDIDFSAFLDRVHPEDRERVRYSVAQSVETARYHDIQCRIVLPDASTRWIFCKGTVIKDPQGAAKMLLGGVIDITHGKRTDEQLQRSAKLEAIGQLAGGIAHDFNNLLVAILGNLDLAQRDAEASVKNQRLKDAAAAANRAAELTRQLLVFGRRQYIDREPLACDQLLADILRLLERLLPETIEVQLEQSDDLPYVLGDRGQLEQVIVNLCLNARDAMPNGGRLTVQMQPAELSGEFLRMHPWARPGRYLMLQVADTGVGIAANQLEHIFEPFFTTKDSGTGLGLAMAYGVVKRHSGVLQVQSEWGKGTQVRVYLPVSEGDVPKVRESLVEPASGGSETILLAEDESAVRAVVTRMLERVGYTVVGVTDGRQAVERYLQQPDEFSMLLFDVVMPGKSGPEALAEIRNHNPRIPAILCSGYSETLDVWQGLPEGVRFVPKPYEPDRILTLMRQLLDSQQAGVSTD